MKICYHTSKAEERVIVYIIPITALLLSFMSLLASMRFIFSRQGMYWIFPAIISLILFFGNLRTLLAAGEAGASYTVTDFIPFVLAFLWYMMIVVFHYALKKTITENRFENDSIKNRAEAEYLEKYEARMRKKSRKQRSEDENNSASIPSVPEYRTPSDD